MKPCAGGFDSWANLNARFESQGGQSKKAENTLSTISAAVQKGANFVVRKRVFCGSVSKK
jgi:hypothetical protein